MSDCKTIKNAKTSARLARACSFEHLESRQMLSSSFTDGGYTVSTSTPGIVLKSGGVVDTTNGKHLRVLESGTLNSASDVNIYFEYAFTGAPVSFFSFNTEVQNGMTDSRIVKVEETIDHDPSFGKDYGVHPGQVHFHIGNGIASETTFTSPQLPNLPSTQWFQPTPGNYKQTVTLSGGDGVAPGETLSATDGGKANGGLRIHQGHFYSFSLRQQLTTVYSPPVIRNPEINFYEMSGQQITFVGNKLFDLGSAVQNSGGGSMQMKVRNDGDGVLYIGSPNVAGGFKIDGLASMLQPGEEDVFTVRLDTSKLGNRQAKLFIPSNDPDEWQGFPINVKGTVTPLHVPAPEINLYEMNGTQITFVGNKQFNLGSIMQSAGSGGSMDFKVKNDGDATLNMNVSTVPDGFRVEGLASSLQPGQEDVFTVRIDSSKSPATRSGKIIIANNDPDEGMPANPGFGLNVMGTVNEKPKPVTPATVRGRLFNDKNGNGTRDSGEKDMSGWRVYYDANKNGKLDGGENVSATDSKGRWTLANLPAGRRQIRIAPPASSSLLVTGKWKPTTPKNGLFTFSLTDGQTLENRLFGVKLL